MTRPRMLTWVLAIVLVAWACGEAPAAAPAPEEQGGNAVQASNDVLVDCLEAAAGHDDSDEPHDDDMSDMSDMSADEHAAMVDEEQAEAADINAAEAVIVQDHVDPAGAPAHSDTDGHHDDDAAPEHDDTDGHHDDDAAPEHDDTDGHHDEAAAEMAADEHAEAGHDEVGEQHEDADGHDDAAADHHDDRSHEAAEDDPCADVVSSLAKGPIDRVIEVDLVGLEFKPDLIVIKPGETVRFVVTNSWVQEHEFRFTTAADAAAHIDAGHQHAHEVIEGFHIEGVDLLAKIQPGDTATLDITFDGSLPWSMVACMIPGHYEEGMWAEIFPSDTLL